MGIVKLVLSTAALGLAVSVAQPSLAQPGRPKLRPLPGAPGGPGGKMRPYPGAPGAPAGKPGQPPGVGDPAADRKRMAELRKKKAAGKLTDEEKAEFGQIRRRMGPPSKHRRARLAELKQKESDRKLSDDEKKEVQEIQRIQNRHQELKRKHAERRKSRAQRRRAAKRKAFKEFPGLRNNDQAALAEYGKHGQRMAMLERAREVAEAEGRQDLVTRIDQLIQKEQRRHQKWVAKHAGGLR